MNKSCVCVFVCMQCCARRLWRQSLARADNQLTSSEDVAYIIRILYCPFSFKPPNILWYYRLMVMNKHIFSVVRTFHCSIHPTERNTWVFYMSAKINHLDAGSFARKLWCLEQKLIGIKLCRIKFTIFLFSIPFIGGMHRLREKSENMWKPNA